MSNFQKKKLKKKLLTISFDLQHCFWDRSEDQPFRPEMFQVSVGKTYRDYAAREEYKPQFFGVEQILFIDGYNDLAGYYSDDIALLVLDKHIEFHSFIVPICLPQNLQYEEKAVPVGWVGVTAGWGLYFFFESNKKQKEKNNNNIE